MLLTLSLGGNLIKEKSSLTPTIANENSTVKTYEYKELQEIKETNSTYLSFRKLLDYLCNRY